MTFVEREYSQHRVPLGQYHDRRIRESQRDVLVSLDKLERGSNVIAAEWLELIGTVSDLLEQRDLGVRPYPHRKEVVELGQNERG